MCDVLRNIGAALPNAAALNLFQLGPTSTIALETYSWSILNPLVLALAIADFNILISGSFGLLLMVKSMLCASTASLWRIKSITWRTFVGEYLKNFPSALDIIDEPSFIISIPAS
jgi:hypothetical protein